MYSNNILSTQESMTILNACRKNVRKLIDGTAYILNVCIQTEKDFFDASFKELIVFEKFERLFLNSISECFNAY